MNLKRTVVLALFCLLLPGERPVDAQTASDIQIVVGGFKLERNGGQKPAGVSHVTDPVSVGKETSGLWSMSGCGGFSLDVASDARFKDNATAGWRVGVTPTKIVDRAVTFRLRWARALNTGEGYSPRSGDIEVTLRPGESRPIDSVPVPAGAARSGRPSCDIELASLRVAVEYETLDRRLIGADVWLVQRLADGGERSQLQSVRGIPHSPLRFYFDRIPEVSLDIFGHLIAHPAREGVEIALEAVRARADPGQSGYQAARWFRSTLQVKPDEIVEVPLPELTDGAGSDGTRSFSLRIRVRQLRQ